jgi:UDP-N-acetylglucosamine--N-acetylmuramyl-(pentapeptide) pyrophosphoryl-undecaprenol N-acetylglucosamine transferase
MTTVFLAGGGTGGHLYPGLAIARALARIDPAVRSYFIGAKRGIEREVLPRESYPYALLDLHPLYRPKVWNNWKTIVGAAGAWRQMGALVAREQPGAIVGTGGYASGLALAYGIRRGIPVVEQIADSHPGLTARLFARFSRELYLGYPEAARLLPRGPGTVVVDTGCPIDPPPSPRLDRRAARAAWGFPEGDGPVLLIFGGSQGARALNAVVDAWVQRGIPDGLSVIWGTGRANYETHAGRESPRVRVLPYLAPIADAYAASDAAVARAGAMTTSELCAWGLPMILVPLPTAAADHQTANARALAAAGAAVHLSQAALTPDSLDRVVRETVLDPAARATLGGAALARGRPHAAETIARRILTLLRPGVISP